MSICAKCNNKFPNRVTIDGAIHNLNSRKYCLECSPFNMHNTKNLSQKRKPVLKCKLCDSSIKGTCGIYCSSKCFQKWNQKDYIERWLKGEVSGNRGTGGEVISSRVRRWLFERAGNCCEECGWSVINKHTGKIPLSAHHIDGMYNNTVPDNLKLLCPNCHSLTDNYGGRNKGSGRKNRLSKLGS